MVRFYTTADEAMDLYAEHLRKEYPTHMTPFHQRRAQDREAALADDTGDKLSDALREVVG